MTIEFRDQRVVLQAGELCVVPHGVEDRKDNVARQAIAKCRATAYLRAELLDIRLVGAEMTTRAADEGRFDLHGSRCG